MNVLALEASTSSAKAIIYSDMEGILEVAAVPYSTEISDVVTQDPQGMYETLEKCIGSLRKIKEYKIDAIGLCSTWHSLLFLDDKRKPLGRIITWANTDAAETVKRFREDETLNQWIYTRSGCVIHSMYPLWKYIHMRETQPKELEKIAYISSQPEYIFERMTGQVGVSKSVASGSGFMNIHTLEWDEEILKFAGLTPHMLSALREPHEYAPLSEEAAIDLGLEPGIPVIIGGPDGALNQIGGGAMGEGIMTLSIGTSGALRIASEQPILPEHPSTWCYYLSEGKRIAGAATSGAGNCVEWFIKKANQGKVNYDDLELAVTQANLENAPIFLPFLYGERCPGWQEQRPGGFCEVKGTHEIGHLYYSILEGILFNLYQCYDILSGVGGTPKQIRISGGIENSKRWLQMAADIFQQEIYTSKVEHASTIGAAALALQAMGAIDKLSDFQPELGEKIIPNAEKREFYHQRFMKYLEWYNKS